MNIKVLLLGLVIASFAWAAIAILAFIVAHVIILFVEASFFKVFFISFAGIVVLMILSTIVFVVFCIVDYRDNEIK